MQPLYDITNYPHQTIKRGKTLLLMGTAADGPVNIPIPVTSVEMAQRVFGTSGSLYRAYQRAYAVDSTILIYMMRISGEHATCDFYGRNDYEDYRPVLKMRTLSGGEAYNEMQAMIREDENNVQYLQFVFPPHLEMDTLMYNLADYQTMNELVRAINEDSKYQRSCVHASTGYPEYPTTSIITANSVETFAGGEDGIYMSKDDLFLALEYSYGLLDGYYMDYIHPVDARFDDTHPIAFYGSAIYGSDYYHAERDYLSLQDMENEGQIVTFHRQLIDFCKRQESLGIMTHGIIGFNNVANPASVEREEYSYILELAKATAIGNRYGLSTFASGSWIDNGYYVSVISGEAYYLEGTEEEYYENLATSYAAMLAALSPLGTTTNLAIPGIGRLRYEFTSDEIRELSYLGVVAPRNSVRYGNVIANGVTAALPDSDMHSIANVRQVQLTISYLNEAIDEYVGEPILSLIRRRVLHTVIENVLVSLKEEGILIDYSYNLEYDESRGSGSLSVDLQAKNMVESVSASAALRFAM